MINLNRWVLVKKFKFFIIKCKCSGKTLISGSDYVNINMTQ